MTYFVYLIGSNSKSKFITYVGYTNNLKKRLNKHNLGKGAKSTRCRTWKIIFKKSYLNKSSALKAEYFLKKNSSIRKKIRNGFKFSDCLCI